MSPGKSKKSSTWQTSWPALAKPAPSPGEVIAAAFVLNRMEFIPHVYSIIEAWERLDELWQAYLI